MKMHTISLYHFNNSISAALLICNLAACSAPVSVPVEPTAIKKEIVEEPIFNNREIADIFVFDQQDRKGFRSGSITMDQMRVRDSERRKIVLELHKGSLLRTADDLESAAMIFQHGESPSDYRLAFALATLAAAKSAVPTETTWMMAATWDRLMLSVNRPQWYGTQFRRDASGKEVFQPIDVDAVDMAERRRLRIHLPE